MAAHIPDNYEDLVRDFAPRVLHDKIDFENTVERLDLMAGRDLNPDQRDYFATLARLVQDYEEVNQLGVPTNSTVIDRLRYLMEANEMNASNLGELLGDRSLGPKVLNGQRQLSKAHIRKLAQHFSVSSDLFL